MIDTSAVKGNVLKANRKAVSKRLIRLLYVVNRMNNCFKMRKTSVRLRTLTAWGMSGAPSGPFLGHHLGHVWGMTGTTAF